VPAARRRRGAADPRPGPKETPLSERISYHGTGALAFSTRGEYGVRLMVQLAARHGGGPASLTEIATAEDLPRPYLEQLVVGLREAGLVTSTRGARGGYELTRHPGEIRMSEVIRALEGPLAPMVCASEDPAHATACGRSAACTVSHLWLRIRDAIAATLDSMTLADLVPAPIALEPPIRRGPGDRTTSTSLGAA
jgi:Rrf2 family protein